MKIQEKYLEALKQIDGWVKVSDWAVKVGEVYPEVLEEADQQAIRVNLRARLRAHPATSGSVSPAWRSPRGVPIPPGASGPGFRPKTLYLTRAPMTRTP